MSPLTYIFGLPLLAAVLMALIPRNFRFVIRSLALLATFSSMVIAVVMFCKFSEVEQGRQGFQFQQPQHFSAQSGPSFHVGVDGINLGLIVMGAIVAFAATCVSRRIVTREKEFYILLMLMAGGILGAFASLDLVFFYFFHELALVPTFIMIGVWGRGDNKNFAAYQITLYLSLGALLVLLGLLALYLQLPTGQRTFDIVAITNYFHSHQISVAAERWIFPLLLFGFGILVSLWPFHTWAPLGYGSAPTPTAMLHAGVLKKFGLYGLIRIALPLMPYEATKWVNILVLLCLGNIIYVGLVAMRQRNLNLLIGNSSVAHMGFAFLGLASLTTIGITGTVMIMVAHGFLAALTFALSGYLDEELHTLDINQMGGLLRHLPFIGTVMIMAMMAGCGLPGFANFPGEMMVLFGSWELFPMVAGIAIWGALVIGGVYMLRAIRNIWHGEKAWPGISDPAGGWRKFPYILLLGCLILLGCYPRLLTDSIAKSVDPITRMANGEFSLTKAVVKKMPPRPAATQGDSNHSSIAKEMNLSLLIPEMAVVGLALAILLVDLWTPAASKHRLGCLAAIGLGVILFMSFADKITDHSIVDFGGLFISDGLSIFFKRFFIGAALLVVLLGIEFRDRLPVGIAEFHVLVLLALAGMMFAASANDFILVFVSLELITVTFYVLVSFQRGRLASLEAGVKYLVMGGLSAAFLVFGIALLFAASNSTNFTALSAAAGTLANNRLFWLGLLLILVGLAFKTAVFPMQMWAPDVYQGAPTPVTAFLAIASKGAGFVLLLRVLFMAVPFISRHWEKLFMVVAAITILYGNLCALPQRSLKRLLGYSSIAHAGYLMLGVAALNSDGAVAVLYYLLGYLFTLGAAFIVICLVCRESDDIGVLAGLNQRSPVLAAAMAMAMISLAGIPPLAGFAGKLFLLKAVVEHAAVNPAFYGLALVAVVGVVISLAYYFGVIQAIYWSKTPAADTSRVTISPIMQVSLAVCLVGMLYIGLFPNAMVRAAAEAVKMLRF